jgi:hypothetical protein
MPVTFVIDPQARLIKTIGSGDVTLEEVEQHFRELVRAWPDGIPRLNVLLDLTTCSSVPGFRELRSVVSYIDASGGRRRFGRCAVITHRELLYGMLRVFEVFAAGKFDAVRVFRSETDAIQWLVAPAPSA